MLSDLQCLLIGSQSTGSASSVHKEADVPRKQAQHMWSGVNTCQILPGVASCTHARKIGSKFRI